VTVTKFTKKLFSEPDKNLTSPLTGTKFEPSSSVLLNKYLVVRTILAGDLVKNLVNLLYLYNRQIH